MTEATDYSGLDAAVLKSLEIKPKGFSELLNDEVLTICKKLEDGSKAYSVHGFPVSVTPAFRFLDRRLQAMRKKGKVQYDKKANTWGLVK